MRSQQSSLPHVKALAPSASRRTFLQSGACALVAATCRPFKALAETASESLPDYWTAYLTDKAARLNALKAESDDAFYFLTDVHMHANKLKSGAVLAHLINRTHLRNVYCGGDIPVAFGDKDSASTTSLDGALDKYTQYVASPVIAAGGILYSAKGNHDFTVNASYNGKTYGTGVSHTYSSAFAREFIMAKSPRPFAVTNAADPLACYYWRDVPHAKLRYIVIDTSDSSHDESTKAWGVGYCMHETQINWLADYALASLPDGWGAIVIGHIPIAPVVGTEYASSTYNFSTFRKILEAYNARTVYTAFNRTYDFTQACGRILFCLSGHWHADRFTCMNGILHITQCCDAAYSNYVKGSPFCGTLPTQAGGTIHEQSLDCYQTNRADGLVYATRIGAGNQNRLFHTTPLTVPAGGTHTFSASHLSGPLTWACFDGDKGDINESAASVESYTTLYHDHLVSITDGTLTAGTAGSGIVVAMDADYNKEVFCVTVA